MKKCSKTFQSSITLTIAFSNHKKMVMFVHFVNMLLKMVKMLHHSDVTGIGAMQNVLIITRILIWVETDYTFAQ